MDQEDEYEELRPRGLTSGFDLVDREEGKFVAPDDFLSFERYLKTFLLRNEEKDIKALDAVTLLRIREKLIEEIETVENLIDEQIEILSQESDFDVEQGDEDIEEIKMDLLRIEVSDQVFLFFTLANELVKRMLGELINNRIFSEDRRSSSSKKFADRMSQEQQENLLFYTGIIDNGTKSKISNVRQLRGDLVHDFEERHYLNKVSNLESRLDRALEGLNAIHRELEGGDLIENY